MSSTRRTRGRPAKSVEPAEDTAPAPAETSVARSRRSTRKSEAAAPVKQESPAAATVGPDVASTPQKTPISPEEPSSSGSRYRTRRKVICFKESSSSEEDEPVVKKPARGKAKRKNDDDQDFEVVKVLASSSSDDDEIAEEAEEDLSDLANASQTEAKIDATPAKTARKKKYVYNYKKTPEEIEEEERNNPDLVHSIDTSAKIDKWKYEIDDETRVYCKPMLPMLSDKAIAPFVSAKSKKKSIIYQCPHCQKLFTYTLVFKTHLFSCPENKNVPKYLLFCGLYPKCTFAGQRKQEMINHFRLAHSGVQLANDDDSVREVDTSIASQIDLSHSSLMLDATPPPLSITKKTQLEVSHYSFVDKQELKFTTDLCYQYIAQNYKRLGSIDSFFETDTFERFTLATSKVTKKTSGDKVLRADELFTALKFEFAKQQIKVEPFETCTQHASPRDAEAPAFLLVNAVGHVTALDWCPVRRRLNSKSSSQPLDQYLAFATMPFKGLSDSYKQRTEGIDHSKSSFGNLVETPNLIYILKIAGLGAPTDHASSVKTELFAYLDAKIGHIHSLKFRPDFGASYSQQEPGSNFIGYLLATSSSGNAFIFYARDLSKTCGKETDGLRIYEPKRRVVLKTSFPFGQSTASDWSLLNGATQIAVGYANGSIALFSVSSGHLTNHFAKQGDEDDGVLTIYPQRTFLAHETYVRAVKWSKLNSNILASGALFSREIKVWNLSNTSRPLINYEIFCTDLTFSLHSNEVFITKETNLKGENHLCALDLGYNVQYHDKDSSRAHSSLFYSYTTMSSLDQSDFFNKLLICDHSGSVVLTKANNSKYWLQKNKLMNISNSTVARFSFTNESNEDKENQKGHSKLDNSYDLDKLLKLKASSTIVLDLNQRQQPKAKLPANANNPIAADLTNLTKIKWNPNEEHLNWYAVASLSGFIFIHRINELRPLNE